MRFTDNKSTPWRSEGRKDNTMKALFIDGKRNGYGIDQCGRTLTVRELIALLEEYDDDRPVYLRNDNGYTYGSVTERDITPAEEFEDEEDEDE